MMKETLIGRSQRALASRLHHSINIRFGIGGQTDAALSLFKIKYE